MHALRFFKSFYKKFVAVVSEKNDKPHHFFVIAFLNPF